MLMEICMYTTDRLTHTYFWALFKRRLRNGFLKHTQSDKKKICPIKGVYLPPPGRLVLAYSSLNVSLYNIQHTGKQEEEV